MSPNVGAGERRSGAGHSKLGAVLTDRADAPSVDRILAASFWRPSSPAASAPAPIVSLLPLLADRRA